MNFKLILLDIDPALTRAWNQQILFHKSIIKPQNVPKIFTGPLATVPTAGVAAIKFDCIVSPGNSFAQMDGGFDLVITKLFSRVSDIPAVLAHVKRAHYTRWKGYQPVGTSYLIDMNQFAAGNEFDCRFVAHTPTMRVPSVLDRADVVYDCMWSVLNEVQRHNNAAATAHDLDDSNKIRTVAVTGLGTGVGKLDPKQCATLMVLAYVHFLESLDAGEQSLVGLDWSKEIAWEEKIRNYELTQTPHLNI
ncbi:hypothetical protein V1514DRAFT_323099 [Lipomyces japonicus]|uniref:uncharacterized protein n=1 Tax=Lipomyces japonicus TaxID=56871 RepID=UPI0034D00C62